MPFVIWFLIYDINNLLVEKPLIPYIHVEYSSLLSGSSIHLWYLPFIFVNLVAFDIAREKLSKSAIAYTRALITELMFASASVWQPVSAILLLSMSKCFVFDKISGKSNGLFIIEK